MNYPDFITLKPKAMTTITIKYENSWYSYQGRDGFALYIAGKKMHTGLFVSVKAVREYWNEYRPMLCAGAIPSKYK